jgi:hypothetical protein
MRTTTRAPLEMPRDVLKALDKLLDYAAYDEMKHYSECVSDGGDYSNHLWLAIRRVLEWRVGLPGTGRVGFRALLKDADEWAEEPAEEAA